MTLPIYGFTRSGKPIPASCRAPVVATFDLWDLIDARNRLAAKADAWLRMVMWRESGGLSPDYNISQMSQDWCVLTHQVREYDRLIQPEIRRLALGWWV